MCLRGDLHLCEDSGFLRLRKEVRILQLLRDFALDITVKNN